MALDYENFKKIIAKIKSERPTRIGKGGSTSVFTNNKEFQKIVKEITEAGIPIKEAAKKLGVAHSTISNARKELGLATRADVGGYSYLDDPKNIKYIKKNIGNKKLTTMGKELFPNVPVETSLARIRLLREKHLPKSLRTGEFSAEAKAELSPEKAAERARNRARIRTAKLTKNSDVNVERSINKLKKGYGVDLAHLQRKSLPQTTTNIGMDIPASNRGAMEVVEKIISDLENTNKKLYNTYKNKTLPKNVIDKIELNNQKIIDLVYKSNGAVVGNILDEKTGKATEFLASYKYSADDGLFNLPMKEIAKDPQSLAEFKVVALNKAEQIAKLKGKTVEELFPDLLADPDIKKRTDQILQEKNLVNKFVKKVKSVPGGCRAVVTRALGGPIDTCEAIIKSNPKAAALKLNNAITATKGPLKDLKQESQKLANLIDTGQVTTADNLPRPDDAKLADTFKETNLRWNNDVGAFETPNGDIATQADIKQYAADNPMEIKVGEKPVEVATNKSVLANVGKTMARIGAPLPTAVLDSYFIGQQVKEGKGTAEIASNPLNWIGLAAMEPLSKVSGIAESGKLNSALRLGLNPATIRGISRFAGLPGLAVSTAMTAYDQYKKYQNEEGFIYNLFNKEGK